MGRRLGGGNGEGKIERRQLEGGRWGGGQREGGDRNWVTGEGKREGEKKEAFYRWI